MSCTNLKFYKDYIVTISYHDCAIGSSVTALDGFPGTVQYLAQIRLPNIRLATSDGLMYRRSSRLLIYRSILVLKRSQTDL